MPQSGSTPPYPPQGYAQAPFIKFGKGRRTRESPRSRDRNRKECRHIPPRIEGSRESAERRPCLGILNALFRPLLLILSLPLVILTLGLFALVINALLLGFVGHLVKGFHVAGFWPALLGAVIISLITVILNTATGSGETRIDLRHPSSRRPGRRATDPIGASSSRILVPSFGPMTKFPPCKSGNGVASKKLTFRARPMLRRVPNGCGVA